MAILPSTNPEERGDLHVTRRRAPTRAAKRRPSRWPVALLNVVFLAGLLALAWRNAAKSAIAEIYCAPDVPSIVLVPVDASKAPIAFQWHPDRQAWFWVNPWTKRAEAVPVHYFDDGSFGWWVEAHAPKFGERKKWLLGIGAKASSWQWSGQGWSGTGMLPIATQFSLRLELAATPNPFDRFDAKLE